MIESVNIQGDEIFIKEGGSTVGVEGDTDLFVENAFLVVLWVFKCFGGEFYWKLFVEVIVGTANVLFILLIIADDTSLHAAVSELLLFTAVHIHSLRYTIIFHLYHSAQYHLSRIESMSRSKLLPLFLSLPPIYSNSSSTGVAMQKDFTCDTLL